MQCLVCTVDWRNYWFVLFRTKLVTLLLSLGTLWEDIELFFFKETIDLNMGDIWFQQDEAKSSFLVVLSFRGWHWLATEVMWSNPIGHFPVGPFEGKASYELSRVYMKQLWTTSPKEWYLISGVVKGIWLTLSVCFFSIIRVLFRKQILNFKLVPPILQFYSMFNMFLNNQNEINHKFILGFEMKIINYFVCGKTWSWTDYCLYRAKIS